MCRGPRSGEGNPERGPGGGRRSGEVDRARADEGSADHASGWTPDVSVLAQHPCELQTANREPSYGRTPISFASFNVLNSAMLTYHFTRVRVASFVSSEPIVSTIRPPGAVSPATAPSPNCIA